MATAVEDHTAAFFSYARERHAVHLRRSSGAPPPWTDDPVLRAHRFTNVFRELDRTTVWFKENVRDRLRDQPEVLLATVLFRWFNRIETGEVLFNQPELTGPVPWDYYQLKGDMGSAKTALRSVYPKGPWVTGSYMIRSPDGMDKLAGMAKLCAGFWWDAWQTEPGAVRVIQGGGTLQAATEYLQELPGLGPFLAYEVVTDLRHTALLEHAPDIMTWANPGPGARRGLNYIHGRRTERPRKPTYKYLWSAPVPAEQLQDEMRGLLALSQRPEYWPRGWPRWEMRDVEHTLCEFFKYARVKDVGEGTRRRFR